ncbi:HAD family hydrolase [Demequina mangrovi]|uniref:FMN phosphatase YigB, HAD superfamily n=1 Tax=Demequina mangrovi TaxID=1043493 RepID=A0A1H6UT62_9MICO|nr:HAD family hydrolase [Demequina mangrovi]SEI95613.1 FMN phosphatase YigB, HAD superfamily [Demequina mangrovi]
MPRTVIFDFDGTLALGEGPLDAYVRCVDEVARVAGFVEAAAVERARMVAEPGLYRDAYHAVATAADYLGIGSDAMSAGYLASRELLATDAAPIEPAPGLGDFLRRLREHADLVLVTNAPETRIPEALVALGADGVFSRIVCSARKPVGLAAAIDEALARGPVLSVGDIDEFDLAPARERGAATALVGAAASTGAHQVTFAEERLELLYPAIEAWAAGTASIGSVPSGTAHP